VDTVHACDRQTDRQTDRITITKTVQRIASHGKNLTAVASPTISCYEFQFLHYSTFQHLIGIKVTSLCSAARQLSVASFNKQNVH